MEFKAGYPVSVMCTDNLVVMNMVVIIVGGGKMTLVNSVTELTSVCCASYRVWDRDFIIEQGDDFISIFHRSE